MILQEIDKPKTPSDLSALGKLPKEYAQRVNDMNVPPHLKDVICEGCK